MTTTSGRIVPRLFAVCFCCLARRPLVASDEAARQAVSAPVLTAAGQAAAEALIAQHGSAALNRCRMDVDKSMSAAAVLGTVEYLVAKGADVNARSEQGRCPIHELVQYGGSEAVKTLVSLGADIHANESHSGRSVLHLAARVDEDVEVCKILVAAGADVNAKNNTGWTPLHDAAKANRNEAVFDFLVSKGAAPDAKDNGGLTPRAVKPLTRPAIPKGW